MHRLLLIDSVKVLCSTQYKTGHFGEVLSSQSLDGTEDTYPTQQKQAAK